MLLTKRILLITVIYFVTQSFSQGNDISVFLPEHFFFEFSNQNNACVRSSYGFEQCGNIAQDSSLNVLITSLKDSLWNPEREDVFDAGEFGIIIDNERVFLRHYRFDKLGLDVYSSDTTAFSRHRLENYYASYPFKQKPSVIITNSRISQIYHGKYLPISKCYFCGGAGALGK